MGSIDRLDLSILLPFFASLAICLGLMPLLRMVAIRIGWLAPIRKDRWGSRRIPMLGGVGIFTSFLAALIISGLYQQENSKLTWIFVMCAFAMFIFGLYDDAKKTKPPVKLIWQLVMSTVVIFVGNVQIDFFPWPIANILLTYVWIVGITNAINLLDNMDGLAGGIAIISSGILGYFFWSGGQYTFLLMIMALCGAILGFLVFNFPPARIFMGNNGSMFLGFLLAELAIARRTQASNVFATLGVPTLILLLPILDTTFVMITRLLRGKSPILGGTDHTSHRLIAFGLTERQVVLILYGVALVSGIAAAGLESLDYDLSLAFIPLLLIVLTLFIAHLSKIHVVAEPQAGQASIERWMEAITYKRRLFEILLDLMIIGFSYYLAYWTKYGLNMTRLSMDLFLASWPIALGAAFLSFFSFGVYRGIWGFLETSDLLRYGGAALCAGGGTWVCLKLFYTDYVFPGEIFIFFALFLLICLAGSRSSFQILDRFYGNKKIRQGKIGVIIYGADDAGVYVLNWLIQNPDVGYKPIGFIDDKPKTWGKLIHDVRIMGDFSKLTMLVERGDFEGVIISSRSQLDTPQGLQLLTKCREKGIWIRMFTIRIEDIV